MTKVIYNLRYQTKFGSSPAKLNSGSVTLWVTL